MTKNKTHRWGLALDERTIRKLDRIAKRTGISRSGVMRELILQQVGKLEVPRRRLVAHHPYIDQK